VLDSLASKRGPEDVRTAAQREHDALEDACLRLLAARCLPDRAGQPVQLQLHLSLEELFNGVGHSRSWPRPGFPAAAAGPGDDCDAAVAPMVTGRVDHDLADKLAARLGRGPWAGAAAAGELDRAAARQLVIEHAVALLSGPTGLVGVLAAHRHPAPARRLDLVAAGRRRGHRPGPAAPAAGDHRQAPALRRPWLRPAPGGRTMHSHSPPTAAA
jgi:hypothetical protein